MFNKNLILKVWKSYDFIREIKKKNLNLHIEVKFKKIICINLNFKIEINIILNEVAISENVKQNNFYETKCNSILYLYEKIH